MIPRRAWPALLAPVLLALEGCYEEATPTYFEPGEYKGQSDPLRAKLEQGDLHMQLEQRFDRVASDR